MPITRYVATLAVLAAGASGINGAIGQPEGLVAGSKVDRSIAAAGRHAYSLHLEAGQMARVEIAARDIDITIRTFRADGAVAARTDVRLTRTGNTTLVADAAGVHRIEISAADRPAKGGAYRLAVVEVRDATDDDRTRAAAEVAFTRGEQTGSGGDGISPAEARRRSLAFFEDAQRLWEAVQDREGQAKALYRQGTAYMNLGEYARAVAAHRRSAEIRRELGDRWDEASSVYNTAVNLFYLAEFAEAQRLYEEAVPLYREAGNVNGEAFALSGLGLLHHQLGDSVTAVRYYEQAIDRWRQVENRRGEGLGVHNLGAALLQLGENQRALDALNEAVSLRREGGDRAGEAQSLSMLASAYRRVGDHERARELLERVVPLRRQLGDRRGEGYSLQGLAQAHIALGRHGDAILNAERSIELLSALGDRDGEGSGLSALGVALTRTGELQKARHAFGRALELHRAIGNRRMEVQSLIGLGEAFARGGEREGALERLNAALDAARELRLASYETDARTQIGRILLESGDAGGARQVLHPAIETLESWRIGTTSPGHRLSLRAVRESAYELYIEILMELDRRTPRAGHAAEALQFAERTRARGLIDLLAESGVDIREGVDTGLRERQHTLARQIRLHSARLDGLLGDAKRKEESASAERQLIALAADYDDVQRRLRLSSPNYSALTQPATLALADIQKLLDQGDLLLEYAVGERRSYLWAIRRDAFNVYELPGRKALDETVRRARDLVARSHQIESRGAAGEIAARVGGLLLGSVASILERRRLVIVPDEALQLVPFAALIEPGTGDPLIARHEVVVLPSASAIVALRSARRPVAARDKVVALLADPVFDPGDPRVKPRGARAPAPPPSDLSRGEPFERLSFSRREADAIAMLAGPRGVYASLDFDANRTTALSRELGAYPILHFATHAVIDAERPALSGIVLSRVDADGRPQDGWLRLHDVYNLRLGSDLIVLSGCRTATGRELSGEGLVGLTRGFMYAGARSLLASLWDVRDEATFELMRRFYRALLRDRLAPAAALRKAQLSMARDPAWRAPSYWAGFQLYGDWQVRPPRTTAP